jgi:hypothetical protein
MRVLTACEYLMARQRPRGHWKAFKLIRAIKAEAFSKYADLVVAGREVRLTEANRDDSLGWGGEMLAPHVIETFGAQPISLVPIPGSQCTSTQDVINGRVHEIAAAIRTAIPDSAKVRSLLWWVEPMLSAHRGGPRTAEELAPRYVVKRYATEVDEDMQVVLVDDVLTHAGHFRSAAAVLRAKGFRVANIAFAVGRTVWSENSAGSPRPPTDDAFSVAVERFDAFTWP